MSWVSRVTALMLSTGSRWVFTLVAWHGLGASGGGAPLPGSARTYGTGQIAPLVDLADEFVSGGVALPRRLQRWPLDPQCPTRGSSSCRSHDTQVTDTMRVVRLTPPGSGCAIVFGTGMGPITDMTPGSVKGPHLVVEAMAATRSE